VSERGQKKISEIVADQSSAGMKTILKEPSEQRLILGKRDHAIANIARRQNAILAAQTAGAAAVVGDGNNRGEIRNGPISADMLIFATAYMLFQSAQQRGQTRAATQRHDTKAPRAIPGFGLGFFYSHFSAKRSVQTLCSNAREDRTAIKFTGKTK
jgi:hypothetical protein